MTKSPEKPHFEPLLTTVDGGLAMLGRAIGRSTFLKLMYAGEIESVCIGKRRLPLVASVKKLAESGGGEFLRSSKKPGRPKKAKPDRGHTRDQFAREQDHGRAEAAKSQERCDQGTRMADREMNEHAQHVLAVVKEQQEPKAKCRIKRG